MSERGTEKEIKKGGGKKRMKGRDENEKRKGKGREREKRGLIREDTGGERQRER